MSFSYKAISRQGITENVWSNLSDDFKLIWQIITVTISLLLTYFYIKKTGFDYIDITLKLITSVLTLLYINLQRNLSKYKNLRKILVPVAIKTGTLIFIMLGLLILAVVAIHFYITMQPVYSLLKRINHVPDIFRESLFFAFLCMFVPPIKKVIFDMKIYLLFSEIPSLILMKIYLNPSTANHIAEFIGIEIITIFMVVSVLGILFDTFTLVITILSAIM